jgi:outer membrane protein assembly factor BamB
MAFQGDVAQIPLSNILQALLLNGQEGLLTLELGPLRRRIRLLKQGLRLLNHDANTADLLKMVLLKQRILTETQFQNVISAWVPGSCPPGDFLVNRRIITADVVTSQVLRQLENTLLEVLLTPKLKYEFTADEDTTIYELFSPSGLGQHLVFNPNAILMEAMRREDDWRRFRQEISSSSEIFTVARGALSAKDLNLNPQHIRELKPLINGETSVDRMVAGSTLSSFQVYDVLFQLKQRGLIRPLTLEEKRALADRFRRSLRATDATEIYRSIIASDPNDRAARLQLIALCEKAGGLQDELFQHYLYLGKDPKAGTTAERKAYLEKALALSSSNLEVLELLFAAHRETGNHKEAMAAARSVISAAKGGRNNAQAIDLLYKFINFYPEETILFHELAELHLAANDEQSALEALKNAADIYERRKEFTRLRKTYEKILRLKPDEAHRLRKIAHLEKKKKRKSKGTLKFVLSSAIITVLAGGVLFFAANEVCSRMLYALVLADTETQTRYGQFDRAKANLEDFEQVYPFSTCMYETQERLKEINRLLIARREDLESTHEKRRLVAEAELVKARLAIKENDYVKAHDLLRPLELEGVRPEQAQEITSVLAYLKQYFAEADALLRAADLADKNQDLPQSHLVRRQIISQYPHSRAARELLIPVLIETIPPGADLIADGRLAGQTPIVVRISPSKPPSILLTKKGYASIHLNRDPVGGEYFNPTRAHRVTVPLEKSVEWRFDARSSIEGFPVVVDDTVVLGTRNGDLFCLKQDTGEVVWTFSIPGNMDFAGGLGLWNNLLYFGSYDGRVYVLDAATGKPVHQPFQASPELWPIKSAPSAPSERGLIAVNCDKRLLSTFNLATGKPGWALAFTTGKLLGQPLAYQGTLFVATNTGDVIALSHETGEIQKRLSAGGEIASRGRVSRETYFVGTTQGKFVALDLKTGQPAWSHDCGDRIVSPPTVDGDWVLVATSQGKIFCFSTGGAFKWSYETGDVILPDAEGVSFRNNFYIGTRRGMILCMDIWSGRALWEFKTAGHYEKEQRGILSSGIVSKGKLFIGSEDHFFYCFSLD